MCHKEKGETDVGQITVLICMLLMPVALYQILQRSFLRFEQVRVDKITDSIQPNLDN